VADPDFALTARTDLVMVELDLDADRAQLLRDEPADVGGLIGGGGSGVSGLAVEFVALVRGLVASGVPVALGGINEVEGGVAVLLVADIVEDEELELGAELRLVSNA
jgi:hypothetical protein